MSEDRCTQPQDEFRILIHYSLTTLKKALTSISFLWIAVAFLLLRSKNRSFLLIRSSRARLIYLTLEVTTLGL